MTAANDLFSLSNFHFSDTTAASLTCLFYELTVRPEKLAILQQETDEFFDGTKVVDAVALAKLPYLNAVINETLRLHPPVPSGVQRMTPPQGLTVGSTFIPGNTIVQIPTHSIFRGKYRFDLTQLLLAIGLTLRRRAVF